jgi:hypothetical protein
VGVPAGECYARVATRALPDDTSGAVDALDAELRVASFAPCSADRMLEGGAWSE